MHTERMKVFLLINPSAGGLELGSWRDIDAFTTLQGAKGAVETQPGEEWRTTERDGITEHALVGDVTLYGKPLRRTVGVYIIEMDIT